MMEIQQHPVAIAALVFFSFVYIAIRTVSQRTRSFGKPPRIRTWDPFLALDYTYEFFTDIAFIQRNHRRYGKTYRIQSLLGPAVISTSDPSNIQHVFSSVDSHYGVSFRKEPFEPFTGLGLIVQDGDAWRHPRKLARPAFAKSRIGNLKFFESLVADMIEKIPGRGETVDVQPLLLRMFMQNALYFSLGYDARDGASNAPLSYDAFMSKWSDGMNGIALRMAMGGLRWLLPKQAFELACDKVHSFVEYHMDLAVAKSADKDSPVLAEALLAETQDRALLRDMLVQFVIGSQDTTSVTLSNAIHLLARHPEIWQQLRVEVLRLGNDIFTFEALRLNQVIRNILLETLRLRPIFPTLDRTAKRDTTLPTGGGQDGSLPVVVAAGTRIQGAVYCLHRDESIFGSDVESFKPHRWESIDPGQWEFFAFGGGPRSCLGKDKSMIEAAYVLGRLAAKFESLESRDSRDWIGVYRFTCSNMFGCSVAFT